MIFRRIYFDDQWELRRWGYTRHVGDFNELWGYSAHFWLRHHKTGKPKLVKVGNCCWNYNLHELKRAVFKKTGIEIREETARLAHR